MPRSRAPSRGDLTTRARDAGPQLGPQRPSWNNGRSVDKRADIYSLGRIVAWLVTGALPEPNTPSTLDPSNPWAAFVRETTRQDRDERPATIYAALEHLAPVIGSLTSARETTVFAGVDGPDTGRVAVEALKRYLVDPTQRINLFELVQREIEAVHGTLTPEKFSVQTLQGDSFENRAQRYIDYISPLVSMIVAGCAYGEEVHAQHWAKMLRRISDPTGEWGGTTTLLHMRYLPATVLMHAGSLAAVAAERWYNLRALARDTRVKNRATNDAEAPAVEAHCLPYVFDADAARSLPGMDRKYVPASEWLFGQLREPLRLLLPSDGDYEAAFHRTEFLLSLIFADLTRGGAPACRVAYHDASLRRFQGATVGNVLAGEVSSGSARSRRLGVRRDRAVHELR